MIDFLGIGAQKAGTSWLMENLKRHPQVWTPFIKELHYFDVLHLDFGPKFRQALMKKHITDIESRGSLSTGEKKYFEQVLSEMHPQDDDWYRHIFSVAAPTSVKGEITPYYSCLPVEGIRHVQRLMPGAKIIYLIRDPVERAKSALRMALNQGNTTPQLELVAKKSFQARGDYRSNIARWESSFGREKILYIPFGSIKSNPEEVMREVEGFLSLASFADYPFLTRRIAGTNKSELDEQAVSIINEVSVEQYAFLSSRFGTEFVNETR